MSSINTNVTAMAAIRSLSLITGQMSKTQAAVESGLRINKANDDPAVFSIAQTMRADLKGLNAVRDGLAFGKATLTVARDAATKISNELATLKQTVTQGQQQGLDKATMNAQVSNLLNNVRSFAETATFNGVNLLNNSASGDRELRVLRDITGRTINVANQSVISDVASGSRLLNLDNLDVDQGGIRITPPATINPSDGDTVTVRLGTGAEAREFVFEFNRDTPDTGNAATDEQIRRLQTDNATKRTIIAVAIGDGDTLTPQARLSALVDAMKANAIGARMNSNGEIDIFGADVSRVSFSFETNDQLVANLDVSGWSAGEVREFSIGGESFLVTLSGANEDAIRTSLEGALAGRGLTVVADNTNDRLLISGRADLMRSFQWSSTAGQSADTSFAADDLYQLGRFNDTNGVARPRMEGALERDTVTITDPAGNPKVETVWRTGTYAVNTSTFTASSNVNDANIVRGYANVIGADASDDLDQNGTANDFGFRNASSAISTVDEAIGMINSIVAELGARLSQIEGQQEFTKQLTDSIREGLGALVDADLAEESARLTSLQTKQQLAIQSLSIANQQGQALLGLFR